MAIEPTSLSDLLTAPDVPLDPGNRSPGQDFSRFLSEVAQAGVADDGAPTGDVGNPTPAIAPPGSAIALPGAAIALPGAGETSAVGADATNAPASQDAAENPVQTLLMIAETLGLAGKAKGKPADKAADCIPAGLPQAAVPPGSSEMTPDIGDIQSGEDGDAKNDDASADADNPNSAVPQQSPTPIDIPAIAVAAAQVAPQIAKGDEPATDPAGPVPASVPPASPEALTISPTRSAPRSRPAMAVLQPLPVVSDADGDDAASAAAPPASAKAPVPEAQGHALPKDIASSDANALVDAASAAEARTQAPTSSTTRTKHENAKPDVPPVVDAKADVPSASNLLSPSRPVLPRFPPMPRWRPALRQRLTLRCTSKRSRTC